VAELGISRSGLMLAAAMYAVRMFAQTAGVHRYFAHRAFKTSRAMQFVLAVIGTASAQLGLLWWASQHRLHHRHADGDRDPHSRQEGVGRRMGQQADDRWRAIRADRTERRYRLGRRERETREEEGRKLAGRRWSQACVPVRWRHNRAFSLGMRSQTHELTGA
jgi:Fatty acid desaturase